MHLRDSAKVCFSQTCTAFSNFRSGVVRIGYFDSILEATHEFIMWLKFFIHIFGFSLFVYIPHEFLHIYFILCYFWTHFISLLDWFYIFVELLQPFFHWYFRNSNGCIIGIMSGVKRQYFNDGLHGCNDSEEQQALAVIRMVWICILLFLAL